ncbi:hypothetical protein MFIFM68171_09720 [Madurella fahalii]|uniref:Uncharacterized protein n=1 Tax=Madurella fahalii TaxID=1157608 RepID=A0ABQ0GP48_9PEZI
MRAATEAQTNGYLFSKLMGYMRRSPDAFRLAAMPDYSRISWLGPDLDIRYIWVIEQVQRGRLRIKHVKSIEMPADGLTKPLLRDVA